MPDNLTFHGDKVVNITRKCVIFPADGSQTHLADMTIRAVKANGTPKAKFYIYGVEFGVDGHKMRIISIDYGPSPHHLSLTRNSRREPPSYCYFKIYFSMSPNLPINLNIAHSVGITSASLKTDRRLFWRGDVVAMLVKRETGIHRGMYKNEPLNADLSQLNLLEGVFWREYRRGYLEGLLEYDESKYISVKNSFLQSTLSSFDLCRIGKDEAERQNFLNELNELRCIVRRPPFSPIIYKENPHTEQFFSLISISDSTFDLDTRPQAPDRKLPFELERQIFELCAIENPWLCTTLVQVAKRVNEWIDAILIEAVVFMRPPFSDSSQTSRRLELFLSKLTAGKPAEYYARHVKNLAIIGSFGLEAEVSVINQILAICSGVENLVLAVSNSKGRFDFLAGPQALPNLRRLTITLRTFTIRPVVGQPGSWTKPNFHHHCFSSLTHLHVADKDTSYATFTGWENLTSLTHLALSSPDGQDQTILLLQKLPVVRYIAIGSYFTTRESRYAATTLCCLRSFTGVWSDRVVYLSEIPGHDWERGAWGEGDFWDIVEREVERRLAQKSRG